MDGNFGGGKTARPHPRDNEPSDEIKSHFILPLARESLANSFYNRVREKNSSFSSSKTSRQRGEPW